MAEKLLELRHISKKFSGVTALEDVSIDIEPGEVLTLVGENGAGKSTLIKVITGAHHPTAVSYTHLDVYKRQQLFPGSG